MKTISLFPTLIYQQRLKKNLAQLNKDLQAEVAVFQKQDVRGQEWSQKNYPAGYTSYGSLDQMYKISSTFDELRKWIDQHVKNYLKELEYNVSINDIHMNTLWMNVMPKGGYHTMHIHPHSVISGTYYLQIPKNSSCIKFEDPRFYCFMNSPGKKKTARRENQAFYEVQPRVGDVVLFESWIRHEVPQNKSTQARISISFNYDWK